jgi:hypothetical protein
MAPPPRLRKYSCSLGPLTLCVRETADPGTLDVRVTRKPAARMFEQALVIRPGTVLCLHAPRRPDVYVRVRLFNPRIQYGRLAAGGLALVDSSAADSFNAPLQTPRRRRPQGPSAAGA